MCGLTTMHNGSTKTNKQASKQTNKQDLKFGRVFDRDNQEGVGGREQRVYIIKIYHIDL